MKVILGKRQLSHLELKMCQERVLTTLPWTFGRMKTLAKLRKLMGPWCFVLLLTKREYNDNCLFSLERGKFIYCESFLLNCRSLLPRVLSRLHPPLGFHPRDPDGEVLTTSLWRGQRLFSVVFLIWRWSLKTIFFVRLYHFLEHFSNYTRNQHSKWVFSDAIF